MKSFKSTIAAATLFCGAALVQPAQAQSYIAYQNFSNGLTLPASAFPASGGSSPAFTASPSTTELAVGQYLIAPSTSGVNPSPSTEGSYNQSITSPIGGNIMIFHGKDGAAAASGGSDTAYTMTFYNPPAELQMKWYMYAIYPLDPAGGNYSYTELEVTVTANTANNGTVVLSDVPEYLLPGDNNLWTSPAVSDSFYVPQQWCATSLTLTVINKYTQGMSGNDFVLGGIGVFDYDYLWDNPSTEGATNPAMAFGETPVGPTAPSPCTPLPITGLQLTAQQQDNNDVQLTWGTLTEINSKNFTVQRSSDGGKTWVTVGVQPTQAANGNSSVPLTYQITDPNVQVGKYEYRVVETDVDGSTTMSNTVAIAITGGSQVFPNPASTLLNVKLPASANNVPYRLISADGKIVLSGTMTNTGNYGQISVAGIASDIYFLQITVNSAMQTYEVRIQH